MSKGENNMEVRVEFSYCTLLLSAKDAAIIASIMANATRVKREYKGGDIGYVFEPCTDYSPGVEIFVIPAAQQPVVALQIGSE